MKKNRLDVTLVHLGHFSSREQAKRTIMTGRVYVNNQRVDKAGSLVPDNAHIEIKGNKCPYVSRGGLKLEKALSLWPIELSKTICLDIGASTGGFTDCMLQNGASKVYAVDVGYGQLDWRLRQDERVVCKERTNVRHLEKKDIPDSIDFVTIDVSFISLELVLPVAYDTMALGSEIVFLIKPQFEVGKEEASRQKGVIKSAESHKRVLGSILRFATSCGFLIKGLTFSPVTGAAGNIEFLAFGQKTQSSSSTDLTSGIETTVDSAHAQFLSSPALNGFKKQPL